MNKFNQAYNKIFKENARRSAAGLDMDGLMADEERYYKAKAQSGEGEDWKPQMTRNIVKSGSDFLRKVYELGYTGEAGDSDINEIVAQLAQEVEADDRLQKVLDAVVTHMVNAGQADH